MPNNNLSTFFNSPDFSDVTITVENKSMYVHGLILAQYSTVFKKMLLIDMAEKKTKEITLPGKKWKDVEVFIRFLYSPEHRTITADNCRPLLELSHEYGVQEIVSLCEDFLMIQVGVKVKKAMENNSTSQVCTKYLEIAAKYDLNQLIAKCDEYLCEQKFDRVSSCFEQLKLTENYNLPLFQKACLEYAAENHDSIVHPRVYQLTYDTLQIYLSKYPMDISTKLDIALVWVKKIPPKDEENCRVQYLPTLLRNILKLQTAGHLLDSEMLDKIKSIDLHEYPSWVAVQSQINLLLVESWRQKFKTLETSTNDLHDRIQKVRQLIDEHQGATIQSVFRPSALSRYGIQNAATHNYKLLEWTSVLNS